jgi:hypothetical protein
MNERIDGSRNIAQRLRELAGGIEGAGELWVDGQRLFTSSDVSASIEGTLEGDGSARLVVTIGLGSALRPQHHRLERELSWPGD